MFQRPVLCTTAYTTLTPIPVAVRFRGKSAAARLLGSRVRIPLRVCMFVSCECCMFCTKRPLRRADHSFRGFLSVVCDTEKFRISCRLQTPKSHCSAHNGSQLDPILSQTNPIHNILLYFNILFIIIIIIIIMDRYSSVGTATRYGLDGRGIASQWGGEIFRTRPDRPWGSRSLPYNGYRVFPGGKAAGAWR